MALYGDRVLPCRPPNGNNISFSSVSQQSCLTPGVVVSFEVPQHCLPYNHPHCRPPRQSAAWVVVRGGRQCGWSSAVACTDNDFNVVAHCLLFLQNRYRRFANTDSPMFQHVPMLPIFDVRCVHRPNSKI